MVDRLILVHVAVVPVALAPAPDDLGDLPGATVRLATSATRSLMIF